MNSIQGVIYILCVVTALACTILLFRSYLQSRYKLLFWSSVCFASLVADNMLLLFDNILIPHIDLALWRILIPLAGVGSLLYALILEPRR